ncbi:MAG: DUF922 domain-containing protein [Hyphomicrobiales bacterium]
MSAVAYSAPNVSTKFKSYSVPGSSAQQLFSHMSRYGPHANGSPALATTAASFSHSAKLDQGRNCRLRNYKVNMSFVITLPKARNQAAMSKPLRKRWKQFASHARWHELQHKAIWVTCAKRIESKVRRIGSQPSCNVAWVKARAIANAELARCDGLHAAFDNKESTRAASLPLIKQALRPAKSSQKSKAATRRRVSYKQQNSRRLGKMYD